MSQAESRDFRRWRRQRIERDGVEIAVAILAAHQHGGPASAQRVFARLSDVSRQIDHRQAAAAARRAVRRAAVNRQAVVQRNLAGLQLDVRPPRAASAALTDTS